MSSIPKRNSGTQQVCNELLTPKVLVECTSRSNLWKLKGGCIESNVVFHKFSFELKSLLLFRARATNNQKKKQAKMMLQSHCDLVSPYQRTNASSIPTTPNQRDPGGWVQIQSFPDVSDVTKKPLTWHGGPEFGCPKTRDIPESTKALGKTLIELNAL